VRAVPQLSACVRDLFSADSNTMYGDPVTFKGFFIFIQTNKAVVFGNEMGHMHVKAEVAQMTSRFFYRASQSPPLLRRIFRSDYADSRHLYQN
jgi:hypothetical protein